ncbi:TonB-dependent receptor [Sphingopyxis sp. YR583]|uniref:TonB-dependent receptor n=1 Tax=Sphingopyxis sp. YR583 TaxID=1881047 RepID=UPI0008A75068|nr:TonB-dependent receptor [Sphingopyxis sp. YR583]SEH12701.1 TonB-dependent receptor [Sphingopyxis sp. YR583]
MGTNLFRAMLLASAGVSAAFGVLAPAAAEAQEAVYQIDIPAQPLSDALRALGRVTKQNIVFNGQTVRGKRSVAVRGRMTAAEALGQMLGGSGLKAAPSAGGYMVQAGNASGAASGGAQQVRAGQGNAVLVGSVRDHKTGAALKGARVEVVETGESTATGDLGDFRFARLPTGEVTLRISYLGFPEQTESVSVVGGLTNRTDIYLGSGATTEIVVIGQVSARAQALNQERTAENSTTVISGDLLGNFNGNTISDSLRRAPGVAFTSDDLTGDGVNIVVRGLAPDYNQVKLNGIALPEATGKGRAASLNNILADSVSEIKISKTLLASQDSAGTGGLVEIETKSPLDRPKRYFNISADTTQRRKGFGEDRQFAATASARFGADENFGVSASFQLRQQDVTSYSYAAGGVPAAYLPLAPNGAPGSLSELDPRRLFPFESGGAYYLNSVALTTTRVKSDTSNVALSAEWQPDVSTNLRVDYVRSRRKSDRLDISNSIGLQSPNYWFLLPVASQGGETRFVYGSQSNELTSDTRATYFRDKLESTDTLNFRAEHSIGPLILKLSSGYARGSTHLPSYSSLAFATVLPINAANVLPQAVNPETGTVVSLFAPRSGREFPQPLLTPAGFDALRNAPSPTFGLFRDTKDERGRSSNWNSQFSAKYEFGSGMLKYIEAGLTYNRARFRSQPSSTSLFYGQYYPGTMDIPLLSEFGIEFENQSLAGIAGSDTAYRFPVRRSLVDFMRNPDLLVDRGAAFRVDIAADPLIAQQYTHEDGLAGYVQARVDIGKVEVIAGLRVDRGRVAAGFINSIDIYDELYNRDEAYYLENLKIVEGTDVLTSYLPRILVNYRPTDNLVVRAGYYSTVARPQIEQLSSARYITYFAAPCCGPTYTQPGLIITQGNPALKPARTHNFDVGVEWYDGQVGAIKASIFHKRISNLIESNLITGFDNIGDFELPDHPVFSNLPSNLAVELRYPVNNPDVATVWGGEISVERRLTFLPGVLSGLGVYANYTYSKSKKQLTEIWYTSPIYDPDGALVNFETISYQRPVPFDYAPRHSGTLGLTYTRKGFDASLFYTRQDRAQNGSDYYGLDPYAEVISSLDFRGVYNFRVAGSDMRLSLEALNLLKGKSDPQSERSRGGQNGVPKIYTHGYYLGGRSVAIGLSASF